MKRLIRAVLALIGARVPTSAPHGGRVYPRDHSNEVPVWLSDGGPYEDDRT